MLDPLSISLSLPVSRPPSGPTRKLLQPSPDHPDDYILELDYSSVSNFLACPRSSENYSIRSREENGPHSATDFGKLFHLCEELRIRDGWSEETKAKQHELVSDWFLHHPVSPSDHRTSTRMVAVLERYNRVYNVTTPDDWHSAVHVHEGNSMVEVPFKVPLCTIEVNTRLPYSDFNLTGRDEDHQTGRDYLDDFTTGFKGLFCRSLHILYTGRIDIILRNSSSLWVVDHKTSSMGGQQFVDAFRLSRQTLGYVWAAQKLLGVPLSGLIMNAVIIRPPTAKVYDNTELSRHTFHYSQDHLEEWEEGMRYIVSDFVSCLARGYFPQYARSFKSPCADCDYADNCSLPPAQRAGDLASELYRDVTWNPME